MKEERCPKCNNLMEFLATVIGQHLFKCHTCDMNVWIDIDNKEAEEFNG